MARRRTLGKREIRRIARERMDILLTLAGEVFHRDRDLARRYVVHARNLGTRYNIRLSKKDKLMLCRRCSSFLVPGVNCRVRTHEGRVVITCLECGALRRIPFTRERKDKLNIGKGKSKVKKVNSNDHSV